MIPAILASLVAAAPAPAPAESLLITAAQLAARLSDPRTIVFHVGPRADYDSAHIPGAQFMEMSDIAAPRTDSGLALELPAATRLDSVLEARGVSDESRVVLYWSSQWISPTTRTVLTFTWFGLGDRLQVLDGGITAWRAAGRPVSRDAVTPRPATGRLTPRPRSDVVVDAAAVRAGLGRPGRRVIDARNTRFFQGATTGDPRPGHVPGAYSLPFTSPVDTAGYFLPPPALRDLFASVAAPAGTQVVAYCHIGQQATVIWFAARLAGLDARLYDGSWQDWSRRTELPVETVP